MDKETFNAEAQSTQRTAEKKAKIPSPLVLLCVLCASALNDFSAFDLCSYFYEAKNASAA